MRSFIFLIVLYLSLPARAQRKAVPYLPEISLEAAGFNRDSIENLYERIAHMPQKDFRGLVVIKDNKIVIEQYYNSFWRQHIHDVRSAGKSITSLLLGVAIEEGLIDNLEQDVYSFFPKEKYPSMHEGYKKIRLKHLLDMSSGLDADTDDSKTPGNASQWIAKDDWTEYLLGVPPVEEPGKRWVYADIHAVLIAAIIEEKTGMSLRDFAMEKVFDPLGIKEFYWYTNAANQTGGAGNLYVSTLDFAKLGVLVTNKGKWGNKQIVQAEYIDRLLTHKVFDLSDFGPLTDSYGMFWYKSRRDFGSGEVDYLWASGNGGNHLIIIPEQNMVIALTASGYMQWYPHARAYAILGKILNAIE